ncbi:MAG: class I SAM-dependent RNA methyltransferase [Spirochaetaceae bacterium]|jgi:putative N6-adenine-specific DNA methylase|nr:class I SAM-dependent RNA methyltransferase [Spirochaetaceae bacterium]
MQLYTGAALCAVGAEKAVSNELKKLSEAARPSPSIRVLESGFGRVRFQTNLEGLYRALISLRAADRLLLEAGNFPAGDFDGLFEGTRNIPWENFIPRGMGLKVGKVRSSRSALTAETSIQAVVHKAAAERLCNRYGVRRLPEPGKTLRAESKDPRTGSGDSRTGPVILYKNREARGEPRMAELRVYIEKDEARVLLDISGAPLFKRGYRPAGGTAPLRESTAAALILLSGWRRRFPLYDPFCGSGTIIIEAALYAWDQAPGLGRSFTLSDLLIGNRELEEDLRRELAARADHRRKIRIYGSDGDENAAALARQNFRRALGLCAPAAASAKWAGETDPVEGVGIRRLSLEQARAPEENAGEEGYIITNPPYGRRMGDAESAEAGYRSMAVLEKHFPRWKMGVICDHAGFESHFGKKADICRKIKNGALDAYFYQYLHL